MPGNILNMKKVIFYIILTLVGQLSFAQDLVLNTYRIPGYVESEDEGHFIVLARTIAENLGIQLKINILPAKRAIQYFNEGHVDGIFPFLTIYNMENKTLSRAYYISNTMLFYSIDNPVPNIEQDTICLISGYVYEQLMIAQIKHRVYAETDQSCFKMLKQGRVKGVIAEKISGQLSLDYLNYREIMHSENPLISFPVFFAFKKTPEGKKIAKEFSAEIFKLIKSGEYNKIFPFKSKGFIPDINSAKCSYSYFAPYLGLD